MRLIDADAIWYDQLLNIGNKEHPLEWAVSRPRIDAMPTIEAEPKHGRWEFIGGYGYQYRCSKCFMCHERRTPYCPNCGSRMDLEGDAE